MMKMRLDPRTMLILLVLVNITAFAFDEPWIEVALTGSICLLLVLCGCVKAALKWAVFFGILIDIQYFLLPVLPGPLAVMFTILTVYARKILPCLMMASLILKTATVRQFTAALGKWHLPRKFIIPLSITFRYFPAIAEEHRHIRDAMRLRRIRGAARRMECMVVPHIMSAVSTSDELSAAAMTRGIENPGPVTCIIDLRMKAQDCICILLAAVLTVLAFIC